MDESSITARFAKYPDWVAGTGDPTFKQLEAFARHTHAPLGYLFLAEPPREEVPVPDFRTFGSAGVPRPSPPLLDTIYQCQRRQDWYRDYALREGLDPPMWVALVAGQRAPSLAAEEITRALGTGTSRPTAGLTWTTVRRTLVEAIEGIGGLVMVNGVVGADTHRRLDPEEFRGFALCDSLAPLVFVNGADTLGAQVFTLIHELAHLWAGDSALSDVPIAARSGNRREVWANKVAAEVLVPAEEFSTVFTGRPTTDELDRLSNRFFVSTRVVLRRVFDLGLLTWEDYRARDDEEQVRIKAIMAQRQPSRGGSFYNTQVSRVGRTFARAVITDASEGSTLFREAFSLLGTRKTSTYEKLAEAVMA